MGPGTRIDRYVVEKLLGSGGMADVYAVRHATLGSPAALKVLRMRSPRLVQRMLREGVTQARLDHPNIVGVFDLIEVDGAPGLLMDLVDGPTLAQLVACGPMPLARLEPLSRGLLLGLGAAHRLGVVHRDLKPSNVLVTRNDVARIADFGLVTAISGEADEPLTWPGGIMGTPAYMAPEQHADPHRVDARADLFAVGVILVELLCGPEARQSRNWRPIPGLPDRIGRAVRWALQPDPAERAPDVAAFWKAFFDEPFPDAAPPEPTVGPSLDASRRGLAPESSSAIPKPARALVGREQELEAIRTALEAGGALVTLVGAAGVGKTRVAIAVASRWSRDRPVRWVDLQAAKDEQDLIRSVAYQLDATGMASGTALGRALARHGHLLLVLDNLEQLPQSAASVIADWVRVAPSLRVLGTSRQPLAVPEERPMAIAPIPVPEDPSAVLDSAGWRLLEAAAPGGTVGGVDGRRAQRILRTLDGLPLAIELAAARLEILTFDELERRMADRFVVLSDPSGGAGERHGALYAAIHWSWSLLPAAERETLAQLSAFVAPFGLEAAEAVVRPSAAVLDTIHLLVRRNLVQRTGARFSLLATIREFAARQLDDLDRSAVWFRHATWHAERAIGEVPPVELVEEFGAVLDRAGSRPELVELALGCATGRLAVYTRRGPAVAALRTADQVLALIPTAPTDPVARERWWHTRARRTIALRRTGQPAAALAETEALALEIEDSPMRAQVVATLSDLYSDVGREADAHDATVQALALAQVHGPRFVEARCHAVLGTLYPKGESALAEAEFAAALETCPPGDPATELEIHKLIGWARLRAEDYPRASVEYRRVVELARQLGDVRGVYYASGQLGLASEGTGDLAEAERQLGLSAAGMTELGDPIFAAYYSAYCGRVKLRRGDAAGAVELLDAAVRVDGLTPRLRSFLTFALALGHAVLRDVAAADRWASTDRDPPDSARIPGALARGFVAADAGDRAGARIWLSRVGPWMEAVAEPHTRLAARWLMEQLGALARD